MTLYQGAALGRRPITQIAKGPLTAMLVLAFKSATLLPSIIAAAER